MLKDHEPWSSFEQLGFGHSLGLESYFSRFSVFFWGDFLFLAFLF